MKKAEYVDDTDEWKINPKLGLPKGKLFKTITCLHRDAQKGMTYQGVTQTDDNFIHGKLKIQ